MLKGIRQGNHFEIYEGQEGDWKQSAWIMKGKSCLINLIDFYDEMTGSVDEGRAVDAVTLTLVRSLTWVS